MKNRKLKYNVDSYELRTFSNVGAKLGSQFFNSHEDAIGIAKSLDPKETSYVISRVLNNSLSTTHKKWSFRE